MTTAAATLLCIILAFLAIFQLLLIAGLLLGLFAGGGQPGRRDRTDIRSISIRST